MASSSDTPPSGPEAETAHVPFQVTWEGKYSNEMLPFGLWPIAHPASAANVVAGVPVQLIDVYP